MAKILKIYNHEDPILRSKCRDVEHVESWVLELAGDMWMTMLTNRAVGLAANQVGYDYNIITILGDQFEGPMINPVILEKSDEIYHYKEGCLSMFRYYFDTGKRKRSIKVSYSDLIGERQEIWLKDATAVIVQHEIDHLHGIIFTDHLVKEMLK